MYVGNSLWRRVFVAIVARVGSKICLQLVIKSVLIAVVAKDVCGKMLVEGVFHVVLERVAR